jgi:hypothetical protein
MTNRRTRIPSGFASLVVIGFVCTGCDMLNNIKNDLASPVSPKTLPITDSNNRDMVVSRKSIFIASVISLSLSGFGMGLLGLLTARKAIKAANKCSRGVSELRRDNGYITDSINGIDSRLGKIETSVNQLTASTREISARSRLQAADTPLNRVTSPIQKTDAIRQVQVSQLPSNQRAIMDFLAQTNSESTSPSGSTPIKTSAQQQEDLTAAVNRNDRLTIRNTTRTQLNITNDSESAYAIGKLVQTELEEVNGGGSYLLLELDSQLLLYPTDQTLRGFGQVQPTKGIFSYQKQPIATPQVLTPALVELVGSNWRVKQLGTIAVPG